MDFQTDSMLPIEALERDLQVAEKLLANAAADFVRAVEIQSHWQSITTSLKTLIDARRKGANPPLSPSVLMPRVEAQPSTQSAPNLTEGGLVSPENGSEINRAKWIADAVLASGNSGMNPPEIMAAATKAGVHMHKNYPYVVLSKLVEKGLLAKRRGRYYRKEN